MAMGTRKRHATQPSMWVATQDLSRSDAHPFYTRLNQILDRHDFDGYVQPGHACSIGASTRGARDASSAGHQTHFTA
jgi:hypothetical protein